MLNAYRYFNSLDNPFQSLLEMGFSEPQKYVEYIKENNLRCPKTYDLKYFERRIATEQKMRSMFIEKGGKPTRKHPYYFVLGNCNAWFMKNGLNFAIAIPLSKFTSETISFTYGDSFPTFNDYWIKPTEYRNQIFTVSEIYELIERYGFPQDWNPDGAKDIENYIEMQVWSDDVINHYRVNSTSDDFYDRIHLLAESALCAGDELGQYVGGLSIKKIIERIRTVSDGNFLFDRLRSLSHELFVKDYMHGIQHCIRTALYAAFIGVELKIQKELLGLLVEIVLYHDIGRRFGGDNNTHGIVGAEVFGSSFSHYQGEYLTIAKTVIEMHVRPDEEDAQIISKYEAQDDCRQIISLFSKILKDVDSLDYVRFGLRGFRPFLRLSMSRLLVSAAIELNCIFLKYKCKAEDLLQIRNCW